MMAPHIARNFIARMQVARSAQDAALRTAGWVLDADEWVCPTTGERYDRLTALTLADDDPQKIALQVTRRVGRLADEASEIVEDKVVTDPEWERFDARLAAIEQEVAAARAAVRAKLRGDAR